MKLISKPIIYFLLAVLCIVLPTIISYSTENEDIVLQSGLSASYLIGLGIMIWSSISIYTHKEEIDDSSFKSVIAISIGLFLFMPPVLSHDVYIYLLQGQLAIQDIFTYTNPQNNLLHPFVDHVDDIWKICPNHYGPIATGIFALVAKLAGSSMAANLIVWKLVILICTIISGFGLYKISAILSPAKHWSLIFLLICNPVFLIQGIGQMHVDMLICCALIGMIYGFVAKKYWLIGLLVGVVGAIKSLLLVVFLGILLLFLAYQYLQEKLHVKEVVISFIISCTTFAAAYFFVWEGWETISGPLLFHETKEPVKSLTELMSYVYSAFQSPMSADSTIEYNQILMEQKVQASKLIGNFFKIIALIIALPLAWKTIHAKTDNEFIFKIGKLLLLVFIIYSSIMHSWYFLIILPFLIFGQSKPYIIRYLAIVFGLSCAYEIANIMPLDSGIRNGIMIAFTILSVLSYYLYFGKLFLGRDKSAQQAKIA